MTEFKTSPPNMIEQALAEVAGTERRVLRAVQQHFLSAGQAPTLKELGHAVGIKSVGTIHRYVNQLVKRGLLVKSNRWRGLRLGPILTEGVTLPLIGRISPGRPITAIPGRDEIDVSSQLAGPDRYVLQVEGNSMIGAGILDQDWIVLERGRQVANGDIVVALIDHGESTLKQLDLLQSGQIALRPASSSHAVMVLDTHQVKIQGVLTGLLRVC